MYNFNKGKLHLYLKYSIRTADISHIVEQECKNTLCKKHNEFKLLNKALIFKIVISSSHC